MAGRPGGHSGLDRLSVPKSGLGTNEGGSDCLGTLSAQLGPPGAMS